MNKLIDWIKLYPLWTIGIACGVLFGGGALAVLANRNNPSNQSQISIIPSISPQPSESTSSNPTPTPSSSPTSQSKKTASTVTATPTSAPTSNSTPTPTPTPSSSTLVIWNYNGNGGWMPSSTAPSCPNPVTITSPVDLSLVTSVLYPGQVRGNDFKPHGGFRFDNTPDNAITVKAPYGAYITQASRYIESGTIQYLFEFQLSCGIAFRFDHLATLSSKLQEIADTLPEAKVDDSRTTPINPPVAVSKNDTLATKVGVASNTFVDWGVYDLRTNNGVTKDPNDSLAAFGVCWFDWLSAGDETTVRALPATADNKTSDYCQ